MKKDSIYKNFYTKILADDLALAFPVKNVSKIPHFHGISLHNTSSTTLRKREELFSPWVGALILGGCRGNLLFSKRSVSGFKLKEKSLLGCSLDLRGSFLYRFLDLFMIETLPRELSTRSENWGFPSTWESFSSFGEFFSPSLVLGNSSLTPGSCAKYETHKKNTPFQKLKDGGNKFNYTQLNSISDDTKNRSEPFSDFLSRDTSKEGGIQIRKKVLSKEFNVGIRERFSFRDLESFFHLFEPLRGFDINLIFSSSLEIFLSKSVPKSDSYYLKNRNVIAPKETSGF